MSLALVMAARVQAAIDEIAVLKARPKDEREAEEQLDARMLEALAPLIDQIIGRVEKRGVLPGDEAAAQLLIGDVTDVHADLVEVMTDEVGATALEAIAHVEEVVAAALKAVPDELRPFGMDRALFATISDLTTRSIERFTSRTVSALVAASTVDMPIAELTAVLQERLEGEIKQLSRHALGDVRNEATVVAEQQMGVTHHRWVTAGDSNVRSAHARVNGEVVKVGQRFSNGRYRPGGLGCRCHLEPVVVRPVEDQPLAPGWERDDDGELVWTGS